MFEEDIVFFNKGSDIMEHIRNGECEGDLKTWVLKTFEIYNRLLFKKEKCIQGPSGFR